MLSQVVLSSIAGMAIINLTSVWPLQATKSKVLKATQTKVINNQTSSDIYIYTNKKPSNLNIFGHPLLHTFNIHKIFVFLSSNNSCKTIHLQLTQTRLKLDNQEIKQKHLSNDPKKAPSWTTHKADFCCQEIASRNQLCLCTFYKKLSQSAKKCKSVSRTNFTTCQIVTQKKAAISYQYFIYIYIYI